MCHAFGFVSGVYAHCSCVELVLQSFVFHVDANACMNPMCLNVYTHTLHHLLAVVELKSLIASCPCFQNSWSVIQLAGWQATSKDKVVSGEACVTLSDTSNAIIKPLIQHQRCGLSWMAEAQVALNYQICHDIFNMHRPGMLPLNLVKIDTFVAAYFLTRGTVFGTMVRTSASQFESSFCHCCIEFACYFSAWFTPNTLASLYVPKSCLLD